MALIEKLTGVFARIIVLVLAVVCLSGFVPAVGEDVELEWDFQPVGTENSSGSAIAVDALGNVYTTGSFSGTIDFDPGPGTFELTGPSYFISKMDSAGNFVWVKAMGGTEGASGWGIAVDGSGNVYTTGIFRGTVDFDPGPGAFELTSADGHFGPSRDIFVSKLDSAGDLVWVKAMGGSEDDLGIGIAVDASGNVYTTGEFKEEVDFDPGLGSYYLNGEFYQVNGQPRPRRTLFVSKLDADGNFVWARATNRATGRDIALDTSGNVFTTGDFSGGGRLRPGSGHIRALELLAVMQRSLLRALVGHLCQQAGFSGQLPVGCCHGRIGRTFLCR